MQKLFNFFVAFLMVGLLAGCATTYQERATAQGAMVGATAGAVIGAQNDRAVEGAFIGGVLGGLAGAILADDGNDRVVASAPRYHRRACFKGQGYFDRAARTGNLNRKIELMREGLRLCPNNPAAHNDLGVALLLRGNPKAAARHFRHALQLDPDYLPARRNLAHLRKGVRNHHRDRGDREDAYRRHDDRGYKHGHRSKHDYNKRGRDYDNGDRGYERGDSYDDEQQYRREEDD